MIDQIKNNKKLLKRLRLIQTNWKRATVLQSAGEMAYFMLLSLVPILLLIANIIPLFPIDTKFVLDSLSISLPADVQKIVTPILLNYLGSKSNGGPISFALITTMWSASQVFSSLQVTLNNVYGTIAEKNYFVAQFISFLMMAGLLLLMIVSMSVFLFGEQMLLFVGSFIPIEVPFINSFLFWRWIIITIFLIIFFIIIYHFMPNHHLKITEALPGAIFSTIGWMLLSEFFNLYTNLTRDEMLANATIGGFIVFMLFLYFLNVIMLFGAMLNSIIFEWKTGYSITENERKIHKQKREEELGWSGYPEKDEVLLHGKLKKIT